MSKDFILEIGTEPLPARFLAPVLEQLSAKMRAVLRENRLAYEKAQVLGTPRRLAVILTGVADRSAALSREVQGPPARLLKDESGGFTPQAEGFARKQGIKPEDLATVSTPKGEFLLARIHDPGEAASKIFARILPELITSLEFAKSLEWEPTRLRFGRPIRSLVALYGKSVIPLKLAGVRSGRTIFGPQRSALIKEAGEYAGKLKNLLVLADPEERRQVLTRLLETAVKQTGGKLDQEGGLLEETVFMTEHPVPVVGHFRLEFLALPAPLLKMVLKKQLKFFPLLGPGGLLPSFVGVRDGVSEGQAQVREGYERVLTARLSDAAFFLERDRKTSLQSKLPLLKRVTYQNKLGSMADKAGRVEALTGRIVGRLTAADFPVNEDSAGRIAALAYADLVCETVKEFPELQGLMAGWYARQDGLDERIALGLEEFYFPVGPRSPIPTTIEGAVASLAAKIDSLAAHFAVGNAPTSSADPFALRRQALGALRIVLEKQLPLDMEEMLSAALAGVRESLPLSPEDEKRILADLSDFLWGRAEGLFAEKDFSADEIRSVREGGLRHLPNAFRRLSAIHSVRRDPDFEPLAAVFKRAANILKQAVAKKEVIAQDGPQRSVLTEPAEIELFDCLEHVSGSVEQHLAEARFEEGLKEVVTLKPKLDAFFDKVMVMAEDRNLRAQRLALLSRLVRLITRIADLSEIQGPEKSSAQPVIVNR